MDLGFRIIIILHVLGPFYKGSGAKDLLSFCILTKVKILYEKASDLLLLGFQVHVAATFPAVSPAPVLAHRHLLKRAKKKKKHK